MLPECAVALVLLVDVSGSVSTDNYLLQQQGIAAAFTDARVVNALPNEPIAVSLIEWASKSQVKVGWHLIRNKEDAAAFSASVLDTKRANNMMPLTEMSPAIVNAVNFMDSAPCSPTRKVVDVSGDGSDDGGMAATIQARTYAESKDVVINGLPIQGQEKGVAEYYEEYVVTETGFVEVATGFSDFSRAIRRKLIREISDNSTGISPKG